MENKSQLNKSNSDINFGLKSRLLFTREKEEKNNQQDEFDEIKEIKLAEKNENKSKYIDESQNHENTPYNTILENLKDQEKLANLGKISSYYIQ